MKFCTNCGTQVTEGAKFCRFCGKKVNVRVRGIWYQFSKPCGRIVR